MNTNKLREALAEMEAERIILDAGIVAVRGVIEHIEASTEARTPVSITVTTGEQQRSYIDDAVEIYRSIGKPVHVKDMTERASQIRGVEVNRASIESSFIRHIRKSNHPRLAKFGRSLFGLAEWKHSQPTLAQIA
ncbi:MAG: hypothetical protein JO340_17385 [Acidobacteriaceae bacterium]|nr:hypothetical protein [Acidobacteriaceae bacterium]